ADAARSQPGAQTIDKTTKLGCILTAAYADLFGRTGLGDNNRQSRHVEAESGIEGICQSGKPLHEQLTDIIRIAQRPGRTGGADEGAGRRGGGWAGPRRGWGRGRAGGGGPHRPAVPARIAIVAPAVW